MLTVQEILATAAHELRAPLSAIAGWAKLLQEGRLSAEQAERAVAAIVRSAAAQSRLIEDLLVDGRGPLGMALSPEALHIEEIVSGAMAIVEPLASQSGVRMRAQVPRATLQVWGDLQRLQQVFCNLLVNAVKFSPPRSEVKLHVERRSRSVALCIRDQGIGIRSELLPHVFERFRRGDHRRSGLGLGLAIAHHIVDRHGGRILAESEGEGRGATFTVELPTLESLQNRCGTDRPARRCAE
jgi:signal transduction histidine kinase